jgi:DNA-binding GntR family transcriptional regulator
MASKPTIAQNFADSIRRQINEGAYRPGQKLPSLRELSDLHRFSKNTVVAAFELLVQLEKFLDAQPTVRVVWPKRDGEPV